MAPTTNKSKPPARDFAKRPRAKVGKRAPAKVNATDTSFKTATVAVRSQGQGLDKSRQQQGKDATISSAKRMELFSSRGNTLSTLQMSLRHHAAPVRASGLKGIRDAVQSLSSLDAALGVAILEANLPSLLPHLCRCWLDDDDDVRSLALNLYGDILKCLSSSYESADLKCLAPFVPFLCAYASSALNSLDRSIRIDGASIVAMLASAVQSPSFAQLMSSTSSNMSAMSRELSHHVDSLLPSMERLLTSISLGRRACSNGRSTESQKPNTTGAQKGQKRSTNGKHALSAQTMASSKRESREASTAESILLSLAFLLRTSFDSDDDTSETNYTIRDKAKRDLLPSVHVAGECSFLKGGSAQSNSLLLIRGTKNSRSLEETIICSIKDLPTIQDEGTGNSTDALFKDISKEELSSLPKEKDAGSMEKVQQMTSLLETLRGKFVELAHLGKKTDASGLMSSSKDLETMDVLVQIIRLSHSRFQSYYQTISKDHVVLINASTSHKKREKGGKKATKELQNVGECLVAYQTSVDRVLQLLLENFPVKSFGETTNPERWEFTNACICSALAELGGGTLFDDGKKKAYPWIDTVFSYVLPRLNDDQDVYEPNNIEADSYSESISTNMLLKVVMKLLLPIRNNSGDHAQSYLLNNVAKRQELLAKFAKAFFPRLNCPSVSQCVIHAPSSTVELEQKMRCVANTAAGRTACTLVTKLVAQSADSFLSDSTDTEYAILLLQMLSVLPTHLVSWEGKHPTETGLALASILSVARQWETGKNVSEESKTPVTLALEELCLGLRYSLEALYVSNGDSTAVQQPRKKRRKADLKQTCIFEILPEQVQKLAIGLVGLLRSPTEATAKHLSQICSKAFISHIVTTNGDQEYEAVSLDMANYIREVMHLSRRTMSMPTYLSFLLDGSGIEATTGISLLQKQSSPDNVFLYDSAIDQISRFLTTSCGKASQKVLPMLRPILEKWLSAPTKIKENEGAPNETMRLLVQGRAAISILSAFTWDDVLSYNSADNDFVPSNFLVLDDKLDQLLLDSILSLCEVSGSLWSKGNYFDDVEAQQLYLARLLGPVAVLLRYRKGMLKQFLETVSKRVAARSRESQQSEAPNKSAVVEIYTKAILMILKSKDPVLMTSMVQRSDDLQKVLLSVAQIIETSVSGGPLAHLGGKFLHHVNTICS